MTAAADSKKLFRVFFLGEVQPGHTLDDVKRKIAKAFLVSDEALDLMFSGRPVVIKDGLDEKTARVYSKTIRDAGAVGFIDTIPAKPSRTERRFDVDRRIHRERRAVPRLTLERRDQSGRRSTDVN